MKNFAIRKTLSKSKHSSCSKQPPSLISPPVKSKKSHGFSSLAASATAIVSSPINSLSKKCKKVVRAKVSNRLDKVAPIYSVEAEHEQCLHIVQEPAREPSKLEVLISDAVGQVRGDNETAQMLATRLDEYYQEEFNQFLLIQCESNAKADSYLEMVLRAASHLVDQLVQAIQMVAAKSATNERNNRLQEVAAIAQRQLEQYIEPHVFILGNAASTKPSDALRIISWVVRYFALAHQYTPYLQEDSSNWKTHLEEFVQIYLQRGVHVPMKQFLKTGLTLQQEEDVVENREGKIGTGQPTEIAFMYNMQLSVAQENLPPHYLGNVVAACNEVLREFAGQAMLQLSIEWKELSVERLCAIVNDASKISEDIEERNTKYLVKDQDIKVGEELCREFTELALFATRQLCERIMLDMHHESEPILSTIGNLVWEKQESVSAVQRTNATLSDYFEDLEGWLLPYFFPKVLKHCLDLSLERYLEAFFGNTMAKGVKDAGEAARAMRQDYSDFVGFWNSGVAAKYQGTGGFYSEQVINQRLHQLASFAFLMSPTLEPEAIQEEIGMVLSKFATDAAPVVLHLVGLRKRHNAVESMRWHEAVFKASQSELTHEVSYLYKLPDLRNSRFLQNIQPLRSRCMKQTSAGDMMSSTTASLVKKRNLQRMRGMARERVQKFLKN